MERNALRNLTDWNDSPRRKPMLVLGARRTGKTYLVKDIFAERYYRDNYIYTDFETDTDARAFCSGTANAGKIIEYLSLCEGRRIDEHTLLIFDSVQECPEIVSALKYFCQDYGRIPVLAVGTLLGPRLRRDAHRRGPKSGGGFLFPVGKIDRLTLYPLTFDEFLMNANGMLLDVLSKAYAERRPVDGEIHRLAMEQVYRYLAVGGMPEAADACLAGGGLLEAGEILKTLSDNWLSDMELYQASPESVLRSRAVFRNIYRLLDRESGNFSPGLIEDKSKTRDFAAPIRWLTAAHVVNVSFRLREHVSMPLTAEDENRFRLFLGDVGMFSYQSGINAASFISKDRENTLSGIFYENFAATELVAKGIGLFYWRGKSSAEMEFVVESDNRLFPIDVKRGRGTLNSLEKFSNHNRYACAIKVSGNNYGYDPVQRLLTIPFYFLPFVASDLAAGTLKF